MRHFLDVILEPTLWFVADWSLRWAVLIGVAALMMLAFRPRRAAMRQLMCGVALLGGLLLPILPRWGGGWHLAPRGATSLPQTKRNVSSFPRSAWERTSGRSASRPHENEETRRDAERRQRAFPRGAWEREGTATSPPREALGNRRLAVLGLALCWALGVFVLLVRRLGGAWFLERLRRGAVNVQGPAAETFAACRAELRVRGTVRLMTHPRVRSPVLLGLFRPTILVPPDWPRLPVDVQRAALLHELAHVRRRDHWLAPLLEMIRVAFFFHPLVRWLLGRLEYERELLCDEMVVGRGVDRRDYARMLLEFARQSGRFALPRLSGSSYLPIGRRRTVKARINHLLEENMERWMGSLPARWAAVLGAGLLALGVGLASYRVLAVEAEKPNTPAEKEKPAPAEEKKRADTEKSSAARLKREELRYGGKDFNQWRADLLTELKGSIRVDGMKAFAAFGANGYGPEATQAILEIMRGYDTMYNNSQDDDGAVVGAGYRAIEKIGADAVPVLTEAAKNANRNVRRFAIQALGSLGTDARFAVPVLLRAMKDDDAETRRRAITAVGAIDRHAKGVVAALSDALKDKDGFNRMQAVNLIQSIGKEARPAIPALIEALGDKSEQVSRGTIRALRAVGAGKKAVVPVSRLLRDEGFETQVEAYQLAYQFLQSLGADAKEAVPALIAILKDPKRADRDRAVGVLASIGPTAKEAIPALNELLRGDDKNLRPTVVNALRKIGPDDDSR